MHKRTLLLALLLANARLARADGAADEAELHFQLAAERYVAKDFRGALEHFLVSNRLAPNRNVLFNIARSYEQLARYPDAHRYYADAARGETDPKVLGDLEAAMARIAPKVALLAIESTPPGATIYVDREDLGSRGTTPALLAFPAGRYKVMLRLEGHEGAERDGIELVLGQKSTTALSLTPIVGTVEIDADAGAEVRVGDERAPVACVTPCELSLAPGPQLLVISAPGRETATRQLVVTARERSRVRAELAPLTGSVVVSTEERGALVEIDGSPAGFTPVVVPNVPVGARKLRVSLRGYVPIEREIVVEAKQRAELLELPLVPIREVTAASRYAEPIEDAPSSVTIIEGQELRAMAYPTIGEALRGVRGFSLSSDSLYSSINVRGIGLPNDYGNRLLVLSDGMVLNDNILSSSYIGYDGRADLGDIERIEVVRGAGSVLYGTGAVSGVVNLVTRERPSESGGRVSVGTVDNGVARVSGGFEVKVDEDTGFRASFGLARSDGRVVTIATLDDTRTGTAASIVDQFDAGTTMGRLWVGALTVQWLYTARELRSGLGAYGTTFGDPSTSFTDTRAMIEARYEPRLSDALQLLLRAHVNSYGFSGSYTYDELVNDEIYQGTWLGAEARFVLTPLEDPRALRITVGGTLEGHSRAFLSGDTLSIAGVEPYLREDHPYSLGAIYGLAEGAFTDWLRYSAGARLDIFSSVGTSFNPRLALIVKPWDGGVAKLLAGRSFRAPSVYELHYNDGGFTQLASPDLVPETSYSGELELSQRFAEDWVALVSTHVTVLERTIETRGEGTEEAPLVYGNVDAAALTVGGDLELRREWRRGWMMALSYGYQRARFTSVPDGFVDGRVINAPEHIGSIRGAAPLVPGLATLAARLAVEGPRRIDAASTDETSPAVIADVVLSGESERYHLAYSLGVYNLLDWRYEVPLIFGAPISVLPQSGRTLLLELTLRI